MKDDVISRKWLIECLEEGWINFDTIKDTYKYIHLINVAPSAQQQYEPVTAEDFAKTMSENSLYGYMAWHGEAFTLMNEMGFVICKKTM